MRRFAILILAFVFVPISCYAFSLTEFGVRVSVNRLAKQGSDMDRLQASAEIYLQSELDAVWQMKTGIGFDLASLAPFGTVGILRSIFDELYVEGDLVLKWIPHYGIVGTIDTGILYQPEISETIRLILEAYPITWQVISIDHRYFPIPQFHLSLTMGAVMSLEHGGFFGETVTIESYKIEDRRLPFSLFVGNGWYLTPGKLTTIIGF
jgi:hypothetical protein